MLAEYNSLIIIIIIESRCKTNASIVVSHLLYCRDVGFRRLRQIFGVAETKDSFIDIVFRTFYVREKSFSVVDTMKWSFRQSIDLLEMRENKNLYIKVRK